MTELQIVSFSIGIPHMLSDNPKSPLLLSYIWPYSINAPPLQCISYMESVIFKFSLDVVTSLIAVYFPQDLHLTIK